MDKGDLLKDVVEHIGKVSIPALNTKFLGQIERIGEFYERCRACGECVLYETGGICPIVRCPKGMQNGPCGGMYDGKCEVGNYTKRCAWIEIFKRLKSRPGGLELFTKFRKPVDFKKRNSPRESIEEVVEIE